MIRNCDEAFINMQAEINKFLEADDDNFNINDV